MRAIDVSRSRAISASTGTREERIPILARAVGVDHCGLSNDLRTAHDSLDDFAQLLTSLIAEWIGAYYAGFIRNRFKSIGEQTCVSLTLTEPLSPCSSKSLAEAYSTSDSAPLRGRWTPKKP